MCKDEPALLFSERFMPGLGFIASLTFFDAKFVKDDASRRLLLLEFRFSDEDTIL